MDKPKGYVPAHKAYINDLRKQKLSPLGAVKKLCGGFQINSFVANTYLDYWCDIKQEESGGTCGDCKCCL